MKNVANMFVWGSSPVDWCENNFAVSIYIAEFFNTASNLPIIFLPIVALRLSAPYFRYVNPNARFVHWLMCGVGIASSYFHASLTLFGQLLDEISILWVAVAGICTWLPYWKGLPNYLRSNVSSARISILSLAALTSLLSLLEPAVNSYLLMCLGPITILLIFKEVKRTPNKTTTSMAVIIFLSFLVAFSCWASDRFMCNFWRRLDFPYLHATWHLFSAISSYSAITLFCYLEALRHKPQLKPVIKLWPKVMPLVPYMHLEAAPQLRVEDLNG